MPLSLHIPENRLLAILPEREFKRLLPHLEVVRFDSPAVLYEVGAPLTHVYFPRTLVVSWLACTAAGDAVKTGTIGREGAVGVLALWGNPATFTRAVAHVPGEAVRIDADILRRKAIPNSELHGLLCRYTKSYVRLLCQSVACNAVHSVRQRYSRWLLETRDRVLSRQFSQTQVQVARVLGVRRATVAEIAGDLQAAGLIRYKRGDLTILDRRGLEAEACECYRALKEEFDTLLGPDAKSVA
jgi:CRP-like cAMP-binding protein